MPAWFVCAALRLTASTVRERQSRLGRSTDAPATRTWSGKTCCLLLTALCTHARAAHDLQTEGVAQGGLLLAMQGALRTVGAQPGAPGVARARSTVPVTREPGRQCAGGTCAPMHDPSHHLNRSPSWSSETGVGAAVLGNRGDRQRHSTCDRVRPGLCCCKAWPGCPARLKVGAVRES